jgi:hypothetical protein
MQGKCRDFQTAVIVALPPPLCKLKEFACTPKARLARVDKTCNQWMLQKKCRTAAPARRLSR